MLIDLTRQTDKLLFVGMPSRAMRARCGDICYCPAPLGIVTLRKSLFDAPAKASPVQGEVAKIFDFCRRGCCRSKLPLCRNLCEFEAFSTQSLSQKSEIFASSLYTREPWAFPRQSFKQRFAPGNDTERRRAVTNITAPGTHCPWGHPHKQQFVFWLLEADKRTYYYNRVPRRSQRKSESFSRFYAKRANQRGSSVSSFGFDCDTATGFRPADGGAAGLPSHTAPD